MRNRSLLYILAAAFALFSATVFAAGSDFTIEGRLYDASTGNPLNASGITVMLEVVDETDPTCVLYREVHTNLNLSSSNSGAQGAFALRLGTGNLKYQGPTDFLTMFSPSTLNGNLEGGTSPCSVSPDASKHRMVKVKVWDSSSGGTYSVGSTSDFDVHWDTLSPDTVITVAPTSIVAQSANSLMGHQFSEFLLTNNSTALDQAHMDSLFSTANYSRLTDMLSGNMGSQTLTNLNGPTNVSDAATKGYADSYLGAKGIGDLSGLTNVSGDGDVLQWSQAQNKWIVGTPAVGITGLTGDVTSTGLPTATVTIANGAVNLAKKIAPSPTAGSIAMTDSTTGNTMKWSACSTGEVLQQQLSGGMACVSVNALLGATGVTANTYGSPDKTLVATVDAQGRLTSLAQTSISISPTQIPLAGTAITHNVGPAAGDVPALVATNTLPALDGSLLTNVSASSLNAMPVSSAAPNVNSVLAWNGTMWTGVNAGSLGAFVNGGNAFGGTATIGTIDSFPLSLRTGGADQITIVANGRIGLGTGAPTAFLHLRPGASGLSSAPLKFDSTSVKMTTPEAGALEYDGAALWITDNTGVRKALLASGGTTGGQSTTGGVIFDTNSDGSGNDGGLTVSSNSSSIFQVDNSGNTTLFGSSSFTTGSGAVNLNGNTTLAANKSFSMSGTGQFIQTYANSSGPGMQISSSTLQSGALFSVSSSGSSNGTVVGVASSVTSTGAGTNIAAKFAASGNAVNYGIEVQGPSSFNLNSTSAPQRMLDVGTNNDASPYQPASATASAPTYLYSASTRIANNTTSTDNIGAYLELSANNSSSIAQSAFVGAISNPGVSVYSPTIVIGARTANIGYNERMRIDQFGNVGIGATNPTAHIESAAPTSGSDTIRSTGYGVSSSGNLVARSARGSQTSPTATQLNDTLGSFGFAGYGTTNFTSPTAAVTAVARQAFSSTAAGTALQFYTTDVGTNTKSARMTIDTNGNVGIGTPNPVDMLHIENSDSDYGLTIANISSSSPHYPGVNIYNYSGTASATFGHPSFALIQSAGTSASPVAVAAGNVLGEIDFMGFSGSIPITGAQISATAAEGFNSTHAGTDLTFQTVAPGSNGLSEVMRITGSGNVGIGGVSLPAAALVVKGAAINNGSVSASTSIDFAKSNLMYTPQSCGTIALYNLKDGGTYTLAVQGTTAATCTFNAYSDAGASSLTVKTPGDWGPTLPGKHTLFTFMVMGGYVYVAWNPGY